METYLIFRGGQSRKIYSRLSLTYLKAHFGTRFGVMHLPRVMVIGGRFIS